MPTKIAPGRNPETGKPLKPLGEDSPKPKAAPAPAPKPAPKPEPVPEPVVVPPPKAPEPPVQPPVQPAVVALKDKILAKLKGKAMSRQERENIKRKYKADFGSDLYEGMEAPIGQHEDSSPEDTGFWSSVIAAS